jgi:hypothetical protein
MDRVKIGIRALQIVWLRAMAQPFQRQESIDATISNARAPCNRWIDDSLNRDSYIHARRRI